MWFIHRLHLRLEGINRNATNRSYQLVLRLLTLPLALLFLAFVAFPVAMTRSLWQASFELFKLFTDPSNLCSRVREAPEGNGPLTEGV